MITEQQIDFISAEIDKSEITIQDLKDDLLDHFCCAVERHMIDGKSFKDAYNLAYKQICPDGLEVIQKETIFLLNYKKFILMKIFIYSTGLIASMAMSIGFVFRTLHWDGGNHLLIGGMVLFTLIFLPMLAIGHFRNLPRKDINIKAKIVTGYLSAFLLGTSIIFKVFHLQYADKLLLISCILFAFGYLPVLFLGIYKKAIKV